MAATNLHRAGSAATFAHRTASLQPSSSAPSYGSSRPPTFMEGSIVEERDRSGQVLGRYRCGPLLGKGGFARCFEFVDMETNTSLAAKVIERANLIKTKTLSKLHSEIAIHRRMKHRNIVGFIKTFQDDWFVYILLEKCVNQTLMEVSKTRRRFSVAETQFIMAQSIAAIDYMHRNNVIHRDLKLGNMMLDSDMNVKIGDFGLAAELQYDGERKRTICGTPNYIAPEILEGARDGHSFEVDIWSLGVIMYTLLVGEPPFQTHDVKTTYHRIKQCRYDYPRGVDISESGKNLISKILQSRPDKRPALIEIRSDEFFRNPVCPTVAPLTLFPDAQRRARERDAVYNGVQQREALRPKDTNNVPAPAVGIACAPALVPPTTQQPRRSQSPRVQSNGLLAPSATADVGVAAQLRRPRSGSVPVLPLARDVPTVNGWTGPSSRPASPPSAPLAPPSARVAAVAEPVPVSARPSTASSGPVARPTLTAPTMQANDDADEQHLFTAAHENLHQSLIGGIVPGNDEPFPAPTVWVTCYADFSSKYGLAYKLNTGHCGVHFNDSTKMSWEPITNRVEYYARVKETVNGVVQATDSRTPFVMDTFPESLAKKVTLIKYFKSYLGDGTSKPAKRDGAVPVIGCCAFRPTTTILLTDPNMTTDMIYVKRWLLTSQAMIFRLSNRTIQVCFLDGAEILLTHESRVVTYTDIQGRRKTMSLSVASMQGEDLQGRLKFTKEMLCKLINGAA